ncbi:MAG: hypothetical protein C4522_11465 [Desulfobacteraceae bacterium]|nr:MAG: hypothetical protein C4522_11465 [Desulfobacteraceae bacterium]
MEIVIGAVEGVGPPQKKQNLHKEVIVEAKFLTMRQPRKPYGMPKEGEQNRRFRSSGLDPGGSRIMTFLIPDGTNLPQDIASGEYKVLMRFIRNR